MKIGIVTDSTADLPPELVSEYGIEIVPLRVAIGERDYRDGVDLSATDFYRKLAVCGSQPVTSQPSPGIFVECYKSLLQKFDALLSIHLTENLSGTFRTAQMAKEFLPNANIRVIDSQSTSMGLGGLVLEAARAVQRGLRIDQVVELVKSLRDKVQFLVTLDTLDFIRRGGRIDRLQMFLSTILQIKPILKLIHGNVELVEQVRSRSGAIGQLIDDFKSQVMQETKAIISVMHTAAEAEAEKLKAIIQDSYRNAEVIVNQAGPVLGTHVGPGALALIWVPKSK